MKQSLSRFSVGLVAALAIAIPVVFVAKANAQNPPQAGPRGQQGGFGQGQAGQPGQGQPGQPGRFGGQGGFGGGFGGGGGGSIAADGTGIYVLQGNRVFKLDKNNLRVIAEGELPRPQMPQGFGGQGGGNRGGQRGGGQGGAGGGNQTPPPSTK